VGHRRRIHRARPPVNFIPSQGFRHAATLLLTNGVRSIPCDAPAESTCAALERLAHELVALAKDTRAPAEAAHWLISEFAGAVDRMPQQFNRETAQSIGTSILGRIAVRAPAQPESRDLFLIYVPEDRLSVAAPLAIDLVKRRVSVAFAEYEVATESQLAAAMERGLALHDIGVLLRTEGFDRVGLPVPLVDNDRFAVLRTPAVPSAAENLAQWVRRRRVSKA
jgi:hypothetical protein